MKRIGQIDDAYYRKDKMRRFQNLKIIFFDIGGTLLYKKSTIDERIAKELGLDLKEFEEAKTWVITHQAEKFKREFKRIDSLEKQIEYFRKFYKRLLQHLKIKPTNRLIKRLLDYRLKEDLVLVDGVLETLNYLKKKYKLGIITNAFPSRRHYDLKICSLDKYFDPIIISSEVGVEKPNSKIYQIAMQKAKVRPEEVMLVDNKVKYLKGAEKVGIQWLVLIDKKEAEKLKIKNLVIIDKIKDLIDLL